MDGRHGNLGRTSVARHREEVSPANPAGKSNVRTPRQPSSRVTTADGRSPGSRVATLRCLPRTEDPSGVNAKDSPLTVAGAAAAWRIAPRTAFPFDPQRG